MALFPRNDALRTNPPAGDQQLSTNGSNWLFAVTAIFGFSLVSPTHIYTRGSTSTCEILTGSSSASSP